MASRGGQRGHQQQLREPLPPERVDETIDYEIDDGEVRRLGLTPTGDFDVIQHIELPDTPIHVTEYRLAVYEDAAGHLYIPDCPEVRGPIFGPRLLATLGWLKSMGHCSYSTIEAWMEHILQVPVWATDGREGVGCDKLAFETVPLSTNVTASAGTPECGRQRVARPLRSCPKRTSHRRFVDCVRNRLGALRPER